MFYYIRILVSPEVLLYKGTGNCLWADLGTLLYIREYHIKILLDSCGLLYRGTLVRQEVSYEYIRLCTACIYVVGAPEAYVSYGGI